MMRKNSLKIILCVCFLFLIAFSLRIYKVASEPKGVLVDEASIGYNAYSILKTGKDEHGVSYPLVFAAFGDQKLPAYIYATIPFIKVFGLGNLAIRLPSVITGSMLSVAIFFLLSKLGFKSGLSFLGGLITATSPWTLLLSRFSYESNLGLLFFVLGILFSLYALEKKLILLSVISGIFFGLTLYSYIAYKLITPMVLFLLIGIQFRKKLTINLLGIMLFFSFLLTITPQIINTSSKQTTARFNQTGYLFNSGTVLNIDQRRYFCTQKLPKMWCEITSNKILSYFNEYVSRYVNVFSPDYLFFTGDKEDKRLNVDNFGVFYIFLLPFYLVGFIHYWNQMKKGKMSKNDLFVLLSLLIIPLPSMLVGDPHKLRLSGLFPFILILILMGISYMNDYVRRLVNKKVMVTGISVLSILFTLFFMTDFLTIQTHKYEESYGTYIPKLMNYLYTQDKNIPIYIRSISEGIIYYAYFNAINPQTYQQSVIFHPPDAVGFAHSTDLGNIHITDEDFSMSGCKLKKKNINALYVSNENIKGIPDSAKKIIYSENKVDTLAIIYDFKKINSDELGCSVIN